MKEEEDEKQEHQVKPSEEKTISEDQEQDKEQDEQAGDESQGNEEAADLKRRLAPFLLVFSDDGQSFHIEPCSESKYDSSVATAATPIAAEPFVWNARLIQMLTSVHET